MRAHWRRSLNRPEHCSGYLLSDSPFLQSSRRASLIPLTPRRQKSLRVFGRINRSLRIAGSQRGFGKGKLRFSEEQRIAKRNGGITSLLAQRLPFPRPALERLGSSHQILSPDRSDLILSTLQVQRLAALVR